MSDQTECQVLLSYASVLTPRQTLYHKFVTSKYAITGQ